MLNDFSDDEVEKLLGKFRVQIGPFCQIFEPCDLCRFAGWIGRGVLASQPGRVYSREKILASVWGTDVVVGDRTIDVHIRKLREKLGEHYFKTVKGVGYKFVG